MDPTELLRVFDAWEEPLRGYAIWPHRVPLEPPYYPLFAESRKRTRVIDDARKLRWWQWDIHPSVAESASVELRDDPPSRTEPAELVELQLLVAMDFVDRTGLARRCLASLATLQTRLSFEVVGRCKETVVQIVCEVSQRGAVLDILRAYFPDARIRRRSEDLLTAWASHEGWGAVLHLGMSERVFRSVGADDKGEGEYLVEIVGRLASLAKGELGLIQVLFESVQGDWAGDLIHFCESIEDVDHVLPDVERKFRQPLFAVVVRVAALAGEPVRAEQIARSLAAGIASSTRSPQNEFVLVSAGHQDFDSEAADTLDRETRRSGMILSLAELSAVAHLPSAAVRAGYLVRQSTRTRGAPESTQEDGLVLGLNEHEGEERVIRLTVENRLRHTYCVGASGTGKSTLLLSMAEQDIKAGHGFAVIDPHGDLIEDILGRIPTHRAKDVIVLDPSDEEFPIGFNILSAHSDLERTLLASDLVGVFRRFSTSFGDQMVSVLANAILAVLESSEGGTLLNLRNFLVDKAYRARFLESVRDEEVVHYWRNEFPILKGMPQGPILTRLNTFLRPRIMRYMVAQREDRLDLRRIMDERKILLAKLSHGAIGEENAHLLGSLLVARIAQAAMSRQNDESEKRVPFFLYMDEFHHFITPSIAAILSGARKYGLGLILSHQEIRQLKSRSDDVMSAVLGNAHTRIVFRIGEQDAKVLADGLSFFEARDLQNLGIGEAIVRIERPDHDFNVRTTIPFAVDSDEAKSRRSFVRAMSRQNFASRREDVDSEIRAANRTDDPISLTPSTGAVGMEHQANIAASTMQADSSSLPGRGGIQHKYLQSMVRKLGEERGYIASLEKTVLGGHGHIDVLLERHGVRIGCEISVSTTFDDEIRNLTKCLAAGCDFALLVSTDDETLSLAARYLDDSDDRLKCVTPNQFIEFLNGLDRGAKSQSDWMETKLESTRTDGGRPFVEMAGKHVLDASQAAEYIGIATQTLAKKRVSGESPPYFKAGRKILYSREELDEWLAARRKRSTSDGFQKR